MFTWFDSLVFINSNSKNMHYFQFQTSMPLNLFTNGAFWQHPLKHKKSKPSQGHDVIKWKHFLRYWPFVRGNHRSPMDSPHKGQWRAALMFSLVYVWTNGWAKNRVSGDLRCHHARYDVTVIYVAGYSLAIKLNNRFYNKTIAVIWM